MFNIPRLPVQEAQIARAEADNITLEIAALSNTLNEIQEHMKECDSLDHHRQRCVLLQIIALREERLNTLSSNYNLLLD